MVGWIDVFSSSFFTFFYLRFVICSLYLGFVSKSLSSNRTPAFWLPNRWLLPLSCLFNDCDTFKQMLVSSNSLKPFLHFWQKRIHKNSQKLWNLPFLNIIHSFFYSAVANPEILQNVHIHYIHGSFSICFFFLPVLMVFVLPEVQKSIFSSSFQQITKINTFISSSDKYFCDIYGCVFFLTCLIS